jgi:hypothetical protein
MSATPKSKKALGSGCLTLFALPFALVGLGMLGWVGITVARWHATQDWAAVPATVLAAELIAHSGDDSTTYEATATYRYDYEGQTFTGSRVGLSGGADNIGPFHQRLHAELEAARAGGTPVTAFVDPSEPANAVLNRELRPALLTLQIVLGLVFAAIGIGLIVGVRYGAKKLAAEETEQARYPNEPWRWRPEWATGRITSSAHGAAYAAIGFALLWNVVSVPVLVFVPEEIASGNRLAAIALLFPLVGLGLVAWAVRAWLQLRRFKVATLTIPAGPVIAGGRLKGTVRVGAEVPVASDFRLELACVEERVRGSGKNRQRSERLLWQREWRVPRHQCMVTPTLTTIPVDAAVPRDQPLTDTSLNDDRRTITWRLDVAGECPGPDFWSRFELPVFMLAAAPAEPEASELGPAQRASLDANALAAQGIDYARSPDGGETWVFRRGRHKGLALAATVFSAIFGTSAAVLFVATDAPIVLPLVFALLDVLLVGMALSLWLTEYRVTLERGLLTLERRGFLPRRTIEVPVQWLRGVSAKRGMQAGNKLYYDLKVETNEGTHTAASALSDHDLASALAARWLAARAPDHR